MWRLRAAGVVGLLVLLTVGPVAVAAARRTLRPGGLLVADVHGFAARAQVNGHLVGAGGSTTLRADRTGTVHVAYRVPRASGHYRLALVGAPPGPKSRPTYPPASHGDPAALVMIVPRLAILDFTVSPAGGGGSGTDAASGNRLSPAAAQAGRTADTGADVETPLFVAALCLLLGVAALTVGIGPVCSPSSRTAVMRGLAGGRRDVPG
jgi:hypothetical protein